MQNQGNFGEPNQKLELFISCRSLADVDTFSKSDPFVILYIKKNTNWNEYARTELIWNNLNPNFSKTILIDYFFEIQQHLRFEVYHFQSETQSKLIGFCETSVSAITGSKDQVFVQEIRNEKNKQSGKIIVRVDQVKLCNDDIKMQLCDIFILFKNFFFQACQHLINTRFWCCQQTSPFIRFYRLRKDDTQPVLVYESNQINNCLNPLWNEFEIRAQKLCNGDYLMPIKTEVWDYRSNGQHLYIGETLFTVNELREGNFERQIVDVKSKQNQGRFEIRNFQLIEKPSFMDFIMGGIQLNLIVSIDFTASNGHPLKTNSLHHIYENAQHNQYQQAILSVGEILINYDYDKMVPVYGFGCKYTNLSQTMHCFPLTGSAELPEVANLEGIMQIYKKTLKEVIFDGPTLFAPTLQQVLKIAQQSKDERKDNYYILLILTDGEINDFPAAFDCIVAASHLPLSIIIVGVGNSNFQHMVKLDNDDLSLTDSQGKKSQRDLVQFVPFNEFKDNPELLAKEVLQELPDQLIQYMMLVGQKPKPPNCKKQIKIVLLVVNIEQVEMNFQHMKQSIIYQPLLESQVNNDILSKYSKPNHIQFTDQEQQQLMNDHKVKI